MNLDQHTQFPQIDREDMLASIDGLPSQLETAWQLGNHLSLPAWQGFEHVLIAGMGASAIGADLLSGYITDTCQVPVVVHRDYGLPAWAQGPNTLVITSSHSGNTEETLDAFAQAAQRGCRLLAVTTGGKLLDAARQAEATTWTFIDHGQPRAAVGYSFGLLLAAFARLGLIPDPAADVRNAIAAMRAQQTVIQAHVPITQNPAKRLAGQVVGRWVAVFGAGILAAVARRWKGQISELAKTWAQFEFLPEANHNTLAGTLQPEALLPHTFTLFLRSTADHPRNRWRTNLTKQAFMLEGIGSDFVDAQGDTALANLWTSLHLGDYVAYYLAMIYEIDPTPVTALMAFKQEMSVTKPVS